MKNLKSLYSSQTYVLKIIGLLLNAANIALLASGCNSSKRSLVHVNIVKTCLNGIIILGHISVEFEKERKILGNIVHTDFVTLCQPKPRSATKVNPKYSRSVFSLGGNLKEAANDAKRS